MTTYTAIADTDIDADSPGTASLFTLLRDNPIAMAENASGSPDIIGLDPLATYNPSGAASVDITSLIDGTYDYYYVKCTGIYSSVDGVAIYGRVSDDNGSSWKTSGYYEGSNTYAYLRLISGSSTIRNSVARAATINFKIAGCFADANSRPLVMSDYVYATATPVLTGNTNGCGYDSTIQVNALQIYLSSGNITGTIRIYGGRT